MPSKNTTLGNNKIKKLGDKKPEQNKQLSPEEEDLLKQLGKHGNKESKKRNTGKKITVVVTSALLAAATLTIPAVIYYSQNKTFNVTIETVATDTDKGKQTLKLKKGATLGDINVPNRPGYYFAGFYQDEILSKELPLDTKITKETTVYMYYILINYNFKIESPFADHLEIQDVNGNKLDVHSSLHHGDRFVVIASAPEEYEQTVLEVFGAVKTNETTENGDAIYEVVADNKTGDDKEIRIYYDEQIKIFNVKFFNEDGSLIEGFDQQVQYGNFAAEPGKTPTKQPTREHQYKFKGWLLVDKDNTPILDDFGEQQHITLNEHQIKRDTYLRADFEEEAREYKLEVKTKDADLAKLKIMCDGDDVTDHDFVRYGDELTITYFLDEGYHCSKFTINGVNQNQNEVTYTVEGEIKDDKVEIVFEQEIDEYTINFYGERDGQGAPQLLNSQTVKYGGSASYTAKEKEQDNIFTYAFDKWVDGDGGEAKLDEIKLEQNGATLDVYATYSATFKEYEITIDDAEPSNVTVTFESESEEGKKYGLSSKYKKGNEIHSGDTLHYGDKIKLNYKETGGSTAGVHTVNGTEFKNDEIYKVEGEVLVEYSEDVNLYTVNFLDDDGSTLQTVQVKHGGSVKYTGQKTPSRDSDGEFDYTFTGWNGDTNNITQSTNFSPTFKATYIEYDLVIPEHVTAKYLSGTSHTSEHDHKAHTEVNSEYTNTTIKLHKGDQVQISCQPSDGHKVTKLTLNGTDINSDGQYVLKVDAVENKKYEIVYEQKIKTFTVKFYDYDGRFLSSVDVDWGKTAEYQGEPTRTATSEFYYTFLGWGESKDEDKLSQLTNITEDKSFYAKFEEHYQEYKLTITETKPDNVKVTFVSGTSDYHNGDEITTGTKLHFNDKIKVEIKQSLGYHKTTFTIGEESFETDTEYTITKATEIVYEEQINSYKVNFYNHDGTQILQTVDVDHGGTAKFTSTEPTKPSDEKYDYKFIGWGTEVGAKEETTLTNITEQTNFYPVFKESWHEYTLNVPAHVTIKYLRGTSTYDADTVITNEKSIHYGDFISITCTPTEGHHVTTFTVNNEEFGSGNEFEFKGTLQISYDEAIDQFDVVFLDYDGRPLETIKVNYDTGATYPKDNPTRADDNTYHYTFKGWGSTRDAEDKIDLSHIKERTTVYALYDKEYIKYTITIPELVKVEFVSGTSHQPNESITANDTLHYGDKIKLTYTESEGKQKSVFTANGQDIENGGTYTLDGEIPNKNVLIKYEQTAKFYQVQFLDDDDTVLQTVSVEHGHEATYTESKKPSRKSDATFEYIFKGWNGELNNITSDKQFKPTFTEKYIEYSLDIPQHVNVKYLSGTSDKNLPENANHQSHTQENQIYTNTTIQLHNGDNIEISCQLSEGYHLKHLQVNGKTHNSGSTYIIEGETTIDFEQEINEYTIKFYNYNGGKVLYETKVKHDKSVTFEGTRPKHDQDEKFTYEFAGWGKGENATEIASLNNIKDDTDFYAVYTEKYREYKLIINMPDNIVLTYVSGTSNDSKTDGTYKSDHTPHNTGDITADSTFHYGDIITIAYQETEGYNKTTFTVNGSNFESGSRHTVTGDTTIVYAESKETYTVTFYNWDDTLLDTIHVEYGGTAVYSKPSNPTREKDTIYEYTFKGWGTSKDSDTVADMTNISGAISFYALYDAEYRQYTLTIQAAEQDSVIIKYVKGTSTQYSAQQKIESGMMLRYNDVISVDYTQSEGHTKSVFSANGTDLDKGGEYTIQGDTTIIYQETINVYKVEFYNYDGSKVLQTVEVEHGQKADFTEADPDKPSTNMFDYEFAGWGKSTDAAEKEDLTNITGETKFYALFDEVYHEYSLTIPAQVTVTYLSGTSHKGADDHNHDAHTNVNNTYTDTKINLHYDDEIKLEYTLTDGHHMDVFKIGEQDIKNEATFKIKGDAEIEFKEAINKYTVTFLDYDGDYISEVEVEHNGKATFVGKEPTREKNEKYYYTFKGWGDTAEAKEKADLDNITGEKTVYALYEEHFVEYSIVIPQHVTVTLVSGTSHDPEETITEGMKLHYDDVIKVEYKETDGHHKSVFTVGGQDKQSGDTYTIVGDTTIVYSEEINKYIVVFYDEKDADGNANKLGQVEVEWNKPATYKTPSKKEDDTYTYAFDKWTLNDGTDATARLEHVKEGAHNTTLNVYATYKETYKEYKITINDADPSNVTITFVSGEGSEHTFNKELTSQDTLHYGDVISITYTETDGYTKSKFEVTNADKGDENQYTVKGNITVTYEETADVYTIADIPQYVTVTLESLGNIASTLVPGAKLDKTSQLHYGDKIKLHYERTGYTFESFTINDSRAESNDYVYEVKGNISTLTVADHANNYKLNIPEGVTVRKDNNDGTVVENGGTVTYGETYYITVEELPTGYHVTTAFNVSDLFFTSQDGNLYVLDGESTGATEQGSTLSGAISYKKEINTYRLTIPENVIVRLENNQGRELKDTVDVKYGQVLYIKGKAPAAGYHVSSELTVNPEYFSDEGDGLYKVIKGAEHNDELTDAITYATEENTYTLTIPAGVTVRRGSAAGLEVHSGESITYGETLHITSSVETGYHVTKKLDVSTKYFTHTSGDLYVVNGETAGTLTDQDSITDGISYETAVNTYTLNFTDDIQVRKENAEGDVVVSGSTVKYTDKLYVTWTTPVGKEKAKVTATGMEIDSGSETESGCVFRITETENEAEISFTYTDEYISYTLSITENNDYNVTVEFVEGPSEYVAKQEITHGMTLRYGDQIRITRSVTEGHTEKTFSVTGADGQDDVYTVKDDVNITYNEEINTYTVIFYNYDGSQELERITVNYNGEAVFSKETPTRGDDDIYSYSFSGSWASTQNGTEPVSLTNIKAETSLYAIMRMEYREYDLTIPEGVTVTYVSGTSNNEVEQDLTHEAHTPHNYETLTHESGKITLHHGDKIQITYAESTGFHKTLFTVNGTSPENGATHTVDGNTTILYTEEVNTYKLTFSDNLTVHKGTADGDEVTSGDSVAYTDVLFVTWTEEDGKQNGHVTAKGMTIKDGSENKSGCSFNITETQNEAEISFTYKDEYVEYSINIPTGVTVTFIEGSSNYRPGQEISEDNRLHLNDKIKITYKLDAGHHLETFKVDDVARTNEYEHTVTKNVSIEFSQAINTYTLTFPEGVTVLKGGAQGTKVESGVTNNISYNDTLYITRQAKAGYHETAFTVPDTYFANAGENQYTVLDKEHGSTVSIVFEQVANTYKLTIPAGVTVRKGDATGTEVRNGESITYGETLHITSSVETGYHVTKKLDVSTKYFTTSGNDLYVVNGETAGTLTDKSSITDGISYETAVNTYTLNFPEEHIQVRKENAEGDVVTSGSQVKYTDKLYVTWTTPVGKEKAKVTATGMQLPDGTATSTTSGCVFSITETEDGETISFAYTDEYTNYTLTITDVDTANVTVTFVSGTSHEGEATLHSGDSIHYGDVIRITAEPSEGYEVDTFTVNDNIFSSGSNFDVEGNVNIVFTEKIKTYTVQFLNYDESFLGSITVEHGSDAEYPNEEEPTRPQDETYIYTFIGWSTQKDGKVSDMKNITQATTFYAVYNKDYVLYNLTITETLPSNVTVKYVEGTSKDYTADQELSAGAKLHYGDKISITHQASEGHHETTFSVTGADEQEGVYTVNNNVEITFVEDINEYKVDFYSYDGKQLLQSVQVKHGGKAEFTADTPVKPQTNEYEYKFSGWGTSIEGDATTELDNITGATTFYAKFTQSWREYKLSITDELPNNVTVTFESGTESTHSKGDTLTSDDTLHYGDVIIIKYEETPGRTKNVFSVNGVSHDNNYKHTVDGNTSIVYSEDINSYTVTFYDYDGERVLQSVSVTHGGEAKYTLGTPTREHDLKYTYTFIGWAANKGSTEKADLKNITGDTSFYAIYEAKFIEYEIEIPANVTVTFVSGVGSSHTAKDNITLGMTLHYDDVIKLSYKESTGKHKTVFKVGEQNIDNDHEHTVTGRTVITYEEAINVYTVNFYDYEGKKILQTVSVNHGEEAKYTLETQPTKPGTVKFDYTFKGWGASVGAETTATLTNITDDTDFYAIFNEVYHDYHLVVPAHVVVTFVSGTSHDPKDVLTNNANIHYDDEIKVEYNETDGHHKTVFTVEGQNKQSGDTYKIVGDTTIVYSEEINKYIVVFYDEKEEDGTATELERVEVEWNKPATYKTPSKKEDNTYTYAFDKWTLDNGNDATARLEHVKEGAHNTTLNVYATYKETYKEYKITIPEHVTVTYVSGTSTNHTKDKVLSSNDKLHYGDVIKVAAQGYENEPDTIIDVGVTGADTVGENYSVKGNVTITSTVSHRYLTLETDEEDGINWMVTGLEGDLPDYSIKIPATYMGIPVVRVKGGVVHEGALRYIEIGQNVKFMEVASFIDIVAYGRQPLIINILAEHLERAQAAFMNFEYAHRGEIEFQVEFGASCEVIPDSMFVELGRGYGSTTRVRPVLSVTINEGVKEIQGNAFANCDVVGADLNSPLVIPSSVTTIASDAFAEMVSSGIQINSATIYNSFTSEDACGGVLGATPYILVPKSIVGNGSSNTFLNSNAFNRTLDGNNYIFTAATSINYNLGKIPAGVTIKYVSGNSGYSKGQILGDNAIVHYGDTIEIIYSETVGHHKTSFTVNGTEQNNNYQHTFNDGNFAVVYKEEVNTFKLGTIPTGVKVYKGEAASGSPLSKGASVTYGEKLYITTDTVATGYHVSTTLAVSSDYFKSAGSNVYTVDGTNVQALANLGTIADEAIKYATAVNTYKLTFPENVKVYKGTSNKGTEVTRNVANNVSYTDTLYVEFSTPTGHKNGTITATGLKVKDGAAATSGSTYTITETQNGAAIELKYADTLKQFVLDTIPDNVTIKKGDTPLSTGATVNYNDQLTITFTTPAGHKDGKLTVTGLTHGTGDSYTVSETNESNRIKVTYADSLIDYNLSVSVKNSGSGTITITRNGTEIKNGAKVNIGDVLTLKYTLTTGYHLNSFKVNAETKTSDSTFTVGSADVSVVLDAEVNTFKLGTIPAGVKVYKGEAASGNPLSKGASVTYGEKLFITTDTVATGYHVSTKLAVNSNYFKSVSGSVYTVNGTSVQALANLGTIADEAIEYATAINTYKLTIPGNVTVKKTNSSGQELTGTVNVEYGQVLYIKAKAPATGYHVSTQLTVSTSYFTSQGSDLYKVTKTSTHNDTLTDAIKYATAINTYTLNFPTGVTVKKGSASGAELNTGATITYNEKLYIVQTVSPGHHQTAFTVPSTHLTAGSNNIYTVAAAEHGSSVTITFTEAANTYKLTIPTGVTVRKGSSSGTQINSGDSVTYGETYYIAVETMPAGYHATTAFSVKTDFFSSVNTTNKTYKLDGAQAGSSSNGSTLSSAIVYAKAVNTYTLTYPEDKITVHKGSATGTTVASGTQNNVSYTDKLFVTWTTPIGKRNAKVTATGLQLATGTATTSGCSFTVTNTTNGAAISFDYTDEYIEYTLSIPEGVTVTYVSGTSTNHTANKVLSSTDKLHYGDVIKVVAQGYQNEPDTIVDVTVTGATQTSGNYKVNANVTIESIVEHAYLDFVDGGDGWWCIGFADGKSESDVVIPATYRGIAVTKIAENAFESASITKLTIGENVKTIGQNAFAVNEYLSNIIFAANSQLTEIGDNAFIYSTRLTMLDLATSTPNLQTIGAAAFVNGGLEQISIPASTTTIGENAFWNCGLVNVTLNSTTIYKGLTTNSSCGYLLDNATVVTVPANIVEDLNNYSIYLNDLSNFVRTKQGSNYVYNKTTEETNLRYGYNDDGSLCVTGVKANVDVKALTIPNTFMGLEVNRMVDATFQGNTEIRKVTIGSNITSIPLYAFADCSKLNSVTLSDSIINIGENAFYNTALTEITIPVNVASIGEYAFGKCLSLTKINYNAKSISDFVSAPNIFWRSGQSGSGISVTINDSVQTIPANLFLVSDDDADAPKVTSLTIGANVTKIGNYAFALLQDIKTINYNATSVSDLTSGSDVFFAAGANTTINVTIGDSVQKIPAYLFHGSVAPKIRILTIGTGVTSIGQYAFYDSTYLEEITIKAKSISTLSSSSNVFYNAGRNGYGIYVSFEETVQTIPSYLFYISSSTYRPNLSVISIGKNVTSIGTSAFYYSSATNVKVHSPTIYKALTSTTSQGYLIYGANEIRVPHAVVDGYNNTYLSTTNDWYKYTDSANYIFLKASHSYLKFEAIDMGADSYWHPELRCMGLKNDSDTRTSIEIPAQIGGIPVTEIGEGAFNEKEKLTKITLNSGLKIIRPTAFASCRGLSEITIPSSVTRIEARAFAEDNSLGKVNFNSDSNLTFIGGGVFANTGLTSFYIPSKVTQIGESGDNGSWPNYYVFQSCKITEVTIDSATITRKITAANWSVCGGLLNNFNMGSKLYIKSGNGNTSFMSSYLAKLTSDKSGYDLWGISSVTDLVKWANRPDKP